MNKSILMIFYGRHVGGAEMQFLELANFLVFKGHIVTIVCLGGNGSIKASKLDPKIKVLVFDHVIRRIFKIIPKRFSIYPSLYKILSYGIKNKYQVIVSTSYWGDVLGYLISLFSKTKLISLQTVSKCIRNPKIDRFILKHYDYLIAGAEDIKTYLLNHDQDSKRIHVIHNWVDFSARTITQSSELTRRQYGISEQLIIGCIGRLHEQKGQIHLIRAFALIEKIYPNCILVLVGDGPNKIELNNEVIKLNLKERVFLLGVLSGDSYNNILSIMDIFVQPSIFEGLPRTILDAMYMGKPIIASDVNGNREAITHGFNGYLIPPKNENILANALVNMINDHEFRIECGKNAAKVARNKFEMNNQLSKINFYISY